MDLKFWKKKKDGPESQAEQDRKVGVVVVWFGFIALALTFMWASSMHDAYQASKASLEAAYEARIAAASRGPVDIDMYGYGDLPAAGATDADEPSLYEGVSEVAELQNRFVDVTAAGFVDFDAYEADVKAVWAGMEEWFPNDSSHSWYRWDTKKASAGWLGHLSTDRDGRVMGIWTCSTNDGTLLSYSMAWYAGDHQCSNWLNRTTPAGYKLLPQEEYHDTLSGTYETAPGDSDMSGDRTLDDHVDSALTILDGLGLTHGWYDAMLKEAQGGEQNGGQEEAGAGSGTEAGPEDGTGTEAGGDGQADAG